MRTRARLPPERRRGRILINASRSLLDDLRALDDLGALGDVEREGAGGQETLDLAQTGPGPY